jgi:hypothetical protein
MAGKRAFVTSTIFILCAAGIALYVFLSSGTDWPFNSNKPQERHRTRIIVPGAANGGDSDPAFAEGTEGGENYSLKVPMNDGEYVISVFNFDFDFDTIEEQVVAYKNNYDPESPVSITFSAYDERGKSYQRQWNALTAATMPGTVSLYVMDLLGDRNNCILVTGMNSQREHTLTAFYRNVDGDGNLPYYKIAEISMDGSITINETERSSAYWQGITKSQPYVITAYGRDAESENILDRIEITYEFNAENLFYGQSKASRVPGSRIEQQRTREILSGDPKVFENFINDLWYYVSPDGTIDKSQYLYFDPAKREIIFFGDEAQQIFIWQRSTSTRYGLYISSQNTSVSTLNRSLNIEMVSLDSIRMRVTENVRLKINVNASWDGLYRRAAPALRTSPQGSAGSMYTEAIYNSPQGRFSFYPNGEYELMTSNSLIKGRYVFFRVGDRDLLELRPENGPHTANGLKPENGDTRLVYVLANAGRSTGGELNLSGNISLTRVRLGSAGFQELNESPIILTRAK